MSKVRTRFAPSPTGRMHVGNLRTALYAYLIAKHEGGDFILRIEDTDQERFMEGALDIIYRTLEKTGLIHDEGPDKDGADKLPDGVTKDCYAAATADDVVAVTGKWATTAPIEGLDMAKAVYGPIESINTGDMTVDEWQKQLVETWEKCADALEK